MSQHEIGRGTSDGSARCALSSAFIAFITTGRGLPSIMAFAAELAGVPSDFHSGGVPASAAAVWIEAPGSAQTHLTRWLPLVSLAIDFALVSPLAPADLRAPFL